MSIQTTDHLKHCKKHDRLYYRCCSACLLEPLTYVNFKTMQTLKNSIEYKQNTICEKCNQNTLNLNIELTSSCKPLHVYTCSNCGLRIEKEL